MPQLGETVTEGTIIRWLKGVGDEVAHDEPLFEVSTDKVDSEVPSSVAGYVAEILVPEGSTVDVGTRLAVVTESSPAAGTSAKPSVAPEEAAVPTTAPPAPAPAPAPASAPAELPPEAEAVLAGVPSSQEAELAPKAEPGSEATSSSEETESNGKDMVLSPVVRQLVAEYGIDPASVPGTGKGGRVTRADVLSFIDR
jgi:2-oxoglutarate dehydrogenase E2 component (dihydrolipoamide succinyltransferase)